MKFLPPYFCCWDDFSLVNCICNQILQPISTVKFAPKRYAIVNLYLNFYFFNHFLGLASPRLSQKFIIATYFSFDIISVKINKQNKSEKWTNPIMLKKMFNYQLSVLLHKIIQFNFYSPPAKKYTKLQEKKAEQIFRHFKYSKFAKKFFVNKSTFDDFLISDSTRVFNTKFKAFKLVKILKKLSEVPAKYFISSSPDYLKDNFSSNIKA